MSDAACPMDNPPKLVFPCQYPIKVMGRAAPDYKACILDVLAQTKTSYDADKVQLIDSRNGRFQSVRVTITAEGEAHLQALFEALKATGRVQMVL